MPCQVLVLKEGKLSMSAQQVSMARAHLTHLAGVDDAASMLDPTGRARRLRDKRGRSRCSNPYGRDLKGL